MYVCLCKPLTEADVVSAAGACFDSGSADCPQLLERLDLYNEDHCGHCAEHPEVLLAIAEDEWLARARPVADTSVTS
jgi:bacterioferritin-associated ferredoxin